MKFLIIGAGAVGNSLAERLTSSDNEVTLVDTSTSALDSLSPNLDIQKLCGNGCAPQTLLDAGIKTADYFISVTDDDEINIAACYIAKSLNIKAKRIARIRKFDLSRSEISQDEINSTFDLILNPDQAAADYLAKLLKVPGAYDIIEFADGKLQVVALEIAEDAPVANKKIDSLKEIRSEIPMLLSAIIRDQTLIVPRGTDRIRPGDLLYCLTYPEYINKLLELSGHIPTSLKNIMISGETEFAKLLAKKLEGQGASTKLIMPKISSTKILENFDKTLLIQGNVTDQNLLLEENITDVDAFVALSEKEEDNILAALLSKKLGAKFSVALINNPSYLPLVNSIGVDTVVNSYLAASLAIFKFIYSGSILSAFALVHTDASYIEIIAEKSHAFTNKKIKDASIPYGILITAIIRDEEAIIPTGSDMIEEGDRVVIFYISTAVEKLEKILKIKLQLFI